MTEETARYVPEVRIKFLRRQLKERSYCMNIVAASSTLLRLIVAMVKENRKYETSIDAVKAAELLEAQYNEKSGERKSAA